MLEQITYEVPRVNEQRQVVYQVGDLESLSATALYYGTGGSPLGSLGSFGIVSTPLMKIGSGNSGFVKASELNLGKGIAREMSFSPYLMGVIERIRAPGAGDREDADHLNYELLIPGLKKNKTLLNLHIPLFDDKE